MKKTEFQKFAYSEMSKLFLDLYMQGKIKKYTSEAKGIRQKIKYEPASQRSVAIYFFRSGKIHIYQSGDYGQREENSYYEWQDSSDYNDVVATLVKDIAEFVELLNTPLGSDVPPEYWGRDGFFDFPEYWGHDGFCNFAYNTSKFRKSPLAPSSE